MEFRIWVQTTTNAPGVGMVTRRWMDGYNVYRAGMVMAAASLGGVLAAHGRWRCVARDRCGADESDHRAIVIIELPALRGDLGRGGTAGGLDSSCDASRAAAMAIPSAASFWRGLVVARVARSSR